MLTHDVFWFVKCPTHQRLSPSAAMLFLQVGSDTIILIIVLLPYPYPPVQLYSWSLGTFNTKDTSLNTQRIPPWIQSIFSNILRTVWGWQQWRIWAGWHPQALLPTHNPHIPFYKHPCLQREHACRPSFTSHPLFTFFYRNQAPPAIYWLFQLVFLAYVCYSKRYAFRWGLIAIHSRPAS